MQQLQKKRITKVPLWNQALAKLPVQWLSYAYHYSQPYALLIDKLNLAYIPIPKVANTSIKRAIANIPPDTDIRVHRMPFKQVPVSQVDKKRYTVFGFVRNPLVRIISLYERNVNEEYPQHLFYRYGNLFQHKMPFHDFVKAISTIPDSRADKHFRSQHFFLEVDGHPAYDILGRVERIKEDWERLNASFNIGSLGHTNFSIKQHPNAYYDAELYNLMVQRYQKDIEWYGYQEEVAAMKPS